MRGWLRWQAVAAGSLSLGVLLASSACSPTCTVSVKPGESLLLAVHGAPEGALVCLPAGEWDEAPVIDKSLTLRGAGPGKTVIACGWWDQLVIEGAETRRVVVVIEGVTLAGEDSWTNDACLMITGSPKVILRNVEIRAERALGVGVNGPADVTLESCIVLLTDPPQRESFGVAAASAAQLILSRCTIEGWGYGIVIGDRARASVDRSTLSRNLAAVTVGRDGDLTITGSMVRDNEGVGIAAMLNGRVTIERCTVQGNGLGVVIGEAPCVEGREVFTGYVAGKGNTIRNNTHGDVCPSNVLAFLSTSSGGVLDRRR